MLLLLQMPLSSTTLLKPETKRAMMFVPKQHGDVLKNLFILAVGIAILETTCVNLPLVKALSPDSQLVPEETT